MSIGGNEYATEVVKEILSYSFSDLDLIKSRCHCRFIEHRLLDVRGVRISLRENNVSISIRILGMMNYFMVFSAKNFE